MVKRAAIRIVTPGTLTEDTLLDARRHNYLAAVGRAGATLALAWLDISTGEFSVQPVLAAELAAALARVQPGELLVFLMDNVRCCARLFQDEKHIWVPIKAPKP